MRILLVADDRDLIRAVTLALRGESHILDVTPCSKALRSEIVTGEHDAALVELGVGRSEGIQILTRWRKQGVRFPVLILTALDAWAERIQAIAEGAGDYLIVPFAEQELLARLRALRQPPSVRLSTKFKVGVVTLKTREKQVLVNDTPIGLSALEYRCLSYLMHHAGRAVTPDELAKHLYSDGQTCSSNVVAVLIGRLRRKIGTDFIRTQRGFGYVVADLALE